MLLEVTLKYLHSSLHIETLRDSLFSLPWPFKYIRACTVAEKCSYQGPGN